MGAINIHKIDYTTRKIWWLVHEEDLAEGTGEFFILQYVRDVTYAWKLYKRFPNGVLSTRAVNVNIDKFSDMYRLVPLWVQFEDEVFNSAHGMIHPVHNIYIYAHKDNGTGRYVLMVDYVNDEGKIYVAPFRDVNLRAEKWIK